MLVLNAGIVRTDVLPPSTAITEPLLMCVATEPVVVKTGAADTLVTFSAQGGLSVLGYTIAPTLGGSNMHFTTPIATNANQTFDVQAATQTSTLYATVKGYKAA